MKAACLGVAWVLSWLLLGCGRASVSSPRAAPWFEDITERSGLQFIHQVTLSGNYLISEQMGSGGAFLDYDNDGRLDIFLMHNVTPGAGATNRLFHQEADGTFKDVSAGSGLEAAGWGNGVAVGDINNDGLPDLILAEYDRVRLFLNRGGGRFEDVTLAAGLVNPSWAVAVALLDYDRDGWLDVVVANYLEMDPAVRCTDLKGEQDFCGPHRFPSTVARLFHNVTPRGAAGPVRFEDVTARSGLARSPGKAMGLLCADFDGDHWPDIFVTDDGLPNRLFINQRNGTFTEQALVRGLAYPGMGRPASNMGVALGDVDGDGLWDLFVPHLSEENHTLWRQGPRGVFQDQTAAAGLAGLPWHGTGFAPVLADFDCNGALDLAIANGLVRRRPTPTAVPVMPGLAPFWKPYAEPSQLFAGEGQGRFREISAVNPAFSGSAMVGRGLICGDVDNDGALDLLVTSIAGPVRLCRNVAPRRGHWLIVRAQEPAHGNRDGYGAEITVHAGSRRWWRLVQPGYGYGSSHDPRVHFGLGTASNVEVIQVLWPDGNEETFPGGAVDRLVVLQKGSGRK